MPKRKLKVDTNKKIEKLFFDWGMEKKAQEQYTNIPTVNGYDFTQAKADRTTTWHPPKVPATKNSRLKEFLSAIMLIIFIILLLGIPYAFMVFLIG